MKTTEQKIVIVTGANNGIGYESAKAIAKKDHTLIMACRDLIKGEKTERIVGM